MQAYFIQSNPLSAERTVRLQLNGRLCEEALPEIEQSIADAHVHAKQVQIDLSEVTLIDRKAAEYLSAKSAGNIELVNCPAYLQRWIGGKRK